MNPHPDVHWYTRTTVIGIPENKRKDLFTKSFGKMTGFDLFFVHDILDIYGMKIDENGEPGKGVRFEISVPKGQYPVHRGVSAAAIPFSGPIHPSTPVIRFYDTPGTACTQKCHSPNSTTG